MKGMGVEGEDTKEFTKIIIILIGLSSSLWCLPFYHSLTPKKHPKSLISFLAIHNRFHLSRPLPSIISGPSYHAFPIDLTVPPLWHKDNHAERQGITAALYF